MSEVNLYDRCLSFVQDQSSGEWGDFIEREDAKKLVEFVKSETRALSAEVEALRAGLEKSRQLLDCVEQTSGNVWWVNCDDPETAVCDTYSEIEALLNKEPAR